MYWVDQDLKTIVQQIKRELRGCPLLAVDLEYYNADKSQDGCMILSLIQLSTISSDYILDCFTLRDEIRSDFYGLKDIFSDPCIKKILHGCDSDLKYLITDMGIVTINIFDTARAFSFLQRIPPLG